MPNHHDDEFEQEFDRQMETALKRCVKKKLLHISDSIDQAKKQISARNADTVRVIMLKKFADDLSVSSGPLFCGSLCTDSRQFVMKDVAEDPEVIKKIEEARRAIAEVKFTAKFSKILRGSPEVLARFVEQVVNSDEAIVFQAQTVRWTQAILDRMKEDYPDA